MIRPLSEAFVMTVAFLLFARLAAVFWRDFGGDGLAEIVQKGTAEVTLAGRTFTITRRFLDDLKGQNFLDELGRMRKALLVCHAPQDEYVGIENANAIFAATGIRIRELPIKKHALKKGA